MKINLILISSKVVAVLFGIFLPLEKFIECEILAALQEEFMLLLPHHHVA